MFAVTEKFAAPPTDVVKFAGFVVMFGVVTIVIGVDMLHDVGKVYTTVAVPIDTPVTTPPADMVADPVPLVMDHVPPPVALVNAGVVPPTQTVASGALTTGIGLTVTAETAVFIHPAREVPVTVYDPDEAGTKAVPFVTPAVQV